MSSVVYTRYELLRTVRNRRFFIFTLIFPLILFFAIAGSHRHLQLDGISFPLYYMSGMAAYGSMTAVIAGGSRIALERASGWTRQMRITPLSTFAYFRAKVLSSYMLAAISIAALYLSGIYLGVHLTGRGWLEMIGLLLVGLIPFAALGILMGHLLHADSMGPALGGVTALLALLGGAWGPILTGTLMHHLAELLPSYWLVAAGKVARGGHGWPMEGWLVMAIWTIVLTGLAIAVYRRDTARI
jgi:ABC-2 type transport system permease protein